MKSKDSALKNGIYYTPERIIKYIKEWIKKQGDVYADTEERSKQR